MTAALMCETGKPKKRSERPLFHYLFEVAQVWILGTFDVAGVVFSFLNRKIRMLLIRGHRKNCREGVTKNPDRVGGTNMTSGRGTTSWDRKGELSKKRQKI